MFTKLTRLFLIIGCLVIGAFVLYQGKWGGIVIMIAGLLFLFGHFRYGTVFLAFRALRLGHYPKAEKLLSQVSNPNSLSPQFRGYYELSLGMIALHQERALDAESHFRAALDHQFRTGNDRALAEMNLAATLAIRKDYNSALLCIAEASKRPCKHGLIKQLSALKSSIEGLQG